MCKVRLDNIFRWYNKKKLRKEEAQAAEEKRTAEQRTEELKKPISEELQGEMPTPVVPIKTQGTGINTLPRIGLNL